MPPVFGLTTSPKSTWMSRNGPLVRTPSVDDDLPTSGNPSGPALIAR